jgi:hypothetical protein
VGKQRREQKRKQREARSRLYGAQVVGQLPSGLDEVKGMMQRAANNTARRIAAARARGEVTDAEARRLMEILHDSFRVESPQVYIPEMTDEDIKRNIVLMREEGDV